MVDLLGDLHFLTIVPLNRYRRAIVGRCLAFEVDRFAIDQLDGLRRSHNLCRHCKQTEVVISGGIRTSELSQQSVKSQRQCAGPLQRPVILNCLNTDEVDNDLLSTLRDDTMTY